MPSAAGTLERIALELAQVLSPLREILDADLPYKLGIRLPDSIASRPEILQAFQNGGDLAGQLQPLAEELITAIRNEQIASAISAGVRITQKTVQLIQVIKTAGDALHNAAASLPAELRTQVETFASEFIVKTLDYCTVSYLESRSMIGTLSMTLFGLVDRYEVTAPGGASLDAAFLKKGFRLDRLPKLFSDPGNLFREVFGWGDSGFDAQQLLVLLRNFLRDGAGTYADLITLDGQPPMLEAYLFALKPNTTLSPPGVDLELRLPINAFEYNQAISLPYPWALTLGFSGNLAGTGITGSIKPPFDLSFQNPSGTLTLNAGIDLSTAQATQPFTIIGIAGGSGIEARHFGLGLSFRTTVTTAGAVSVEPEIKLDLRNAKINIALGGNGDGFVQTITSGANLGAEFSLSGTWSPQSGLVLDGSGGLEIMLPAHANLGFLDISQLFLIAEIGSKPSLEFSSGFSVQLGPLTAQVERMGIKVELDFPASQSGNLGPVDLQFKFAPPRGVGLSVDAGMVVGGGYLFLDYEREEYAGALELVFSGIVSLRAIGIITTRMPDGSKGFSLLIIITAEFGSGIQLGFGFTLLAVGGLIGLNRTMQLQPLMEGVRSGGINSVMFPQNVVANAPRIISDLKRYFPPEEGKFLIGPMAQLGWGTPALIRVSLGIIIEIPGNIAILGVLKVVLPDEAAALLVLQVNFAGAIEFDKKRLYFFASIFESRILFITIEGEMGLLVGWGDDANFVVSVGGFHPRFSPPPLPFPSPRRIALSILNESWGRIRVEGYFAVTSNTVQFGARAELYFGFDAVNIQGHLAFDALFQFSPFFFVIEISASVSLRVFGIGLFSIRLRFALEGPTPWRAYGSGSLSLLFFEISIDFDETWGERQDTSLPPVEAMPLLKADLEKAENWTAQLPASGVQGVTLRKLQEADDPLVLHPVGVLRISQRILPLDIQVDKLGNQKTADANAFSLSASGGLAKKNDALESFATAQFQHMADTDKLSRPAFEKQHAGLELSVAGQQLQSSLAIRRSVRYEIITLDSNFKRFVRRFAGFWSKLFTHFLGGAAITKLKVSESYQTQLQPFAAKIATLQEGYAVAFTESNKPFQSKPFTSEALAQEFLRSHLQAHPDQHESLHVIPHFEINTAA